VLVALAVLVLLGGGQRAAKAAGPDLGNPSTDELAYASIARSLTHGQYRASLHWPPGAPAMFAVGQKLFPSKDLRAAYWLQALVGTLLIGVVFVLGLLAAGPLVGLGAAGLTAIYPPYLTLAGQLLSEPLGTLLLAAGVAALLAGWRLQRRWPFVLAGVLLGATLLTRTDLLLVPGILAVATALALRREGRRPALTAAGLLLAATLVTVLPWVVFASHRAGHFVPITEGSGSALFVGTYLPGDGTTTGMKRELGAEVQRGSRKYRHTEPTLIPAVLVLDHVARRRPRLDRDAALNAEGVANLRRYAWGDPLSFLGMMAHKASRMWLVSSRAGVATKSSVTRTIHFIVVLALALALIAGCVLRRSAVLLALLAVLGYGTLLHAVFVSKPRYALPLLPLLAVGGLAAVAALWQLRADRAAERERLA
jgi:4-amino-4-deoxy-L-arabinose transferase-like glycosyltransferase